MTNWIPEVPTFRREFGKDGKKRLYLVAQHRIDIEFMLAIAGLFSTGIQEQNNPFLQGYYRIIKRGEEKIIKKIFP
jgi:hypothetical protein